MYNNIPGGDTNADKIASNIVELAKEIESHGIRCTISGLITRADEYDYKVKIISDNLQACIGKLNSNIDFLDHENIHVHHLNSSGLHLSGRGDEALARNCIAHIRN